MVQFPEHEKGQKSKHINMIRLNNLDLALGITVEVDGVSYGKEKEKAPLAPLNNTRKKVAETVTKVEEVSAKVEEKVEITEPVVEPVVVEPVVEKLSEPVEEKVEEVKADAPELVEDEVAEEPVKTTKTKRKKS